MKEYSSQVKTVQTIGLDLGDRYSFYVVLDEGGPGGGGRTSEDTTAGFAEAVF